MKHIIKIAVFMSLFLLMSGCGQKKDIENFNYVSLNELSTSTSAEYSYSDKSIYIEGKLTGFEIIKIDDIDYVTAKVKDGNNNWIIKLGQLGTCSDENLSQYLNDNIRCFGKFIRKIDEGFLIELNLDDKYCIQKGSKTICNSQTLKPSIKYIDEFYDSNAPDVNLESYGKVPGFYRCDGMVDDNNTTSITLYQKDGDYYSSSAVDFNNGDNCVIPMEDIEKIKNGKGVRIYFVIDENKKQNIIYFRSIPLFWDDDLAVVKNKNEKLEHPNYEIVFEKAYEWGDGNITYKVAKVDTTKTYTYNINVLAKNYDSANAAAMWYLLRFNEGGEIILSVKMIGSQESFLFFQTPKLKNPAWTDKNGKALATAPDWFNVTDATDEITKAMIDIIDIDSAFENEFGYK